MHFISHFPFLMQTNDRTINRYRWRNTSVDTCRMMHKKAKYGLIRMVSRWNGISPSVCMQTFFARFFFSSSTYWKLVFTWFQEFYSNWQNVMMNSPGASQSILANFLRKFYSDVQIGNVSLFLFCFQRLFLLFLDIYGNN